MTRRVIGIAGGSGSGKSTVARRVAEALGPSSAVTLDMDGYYRNLTHLTPAERRLVNWDHPDAFDLDLFATQLGELAAGRPIEKPVYDFVTHARAPQTVRLRPADVILVEGILLFVDPRVRALCDVKVFVDTDADLRLIRRIRRDIQDRGRPLDEILDQYLSTVRPMHFEFVEPTRRYADVIVRHDGNQAATVSAIVGAIRGQMTGAAS